METKILLLVLILTQIEISYSENPVVELPYGKVRGLDATTLKGKSFQAFEKIPYAAPPVGDLRFKPPQPPKKWSGVLDAHFLNTACFQLGAHILEESEDCLFLNVYTPKSRNGKLLPVMVYIHGGGFIRGVSTLYPPDLFLNEDVVYVSINYRLGIFGFLSTGDEVVPGNNGMKDQLKALEWVHTNIRLFGGDPDRVTIFGQSTGAGSVGYHLLNQKAAGLFQRAILQSGTFLTQGAFLRNPRTLNFGLAANLNTTFKNEQDSRKLYDFLRNMDAKELNAAAEQYGLSLIKSWSSIAAQNLTWAPVIEVENPTAFLTQKMYGLLKSGTILAVPTMMGFTSEECILEIEDQKTLKETLTFVDQNLDYAVPADMRIDDIENRTKMGVQVRKIYTKGKPFADNLTTGVRYCSDNRITRPMLKHAELFAKIAPTYFYQFSYDGELGGNDVHAEGAESVNHSEDTEYLFCSAWRCYNSSIPQKDYLIRDRMVKLWTNFAKYGNPTPRRQRLLQNIIWPQLSPDCGQSDFFYLDIGDDLRIRNHPKKDTYKAWNKLYDSLGYDDFDTY